MKFPHWLAYLAVPGFFMVAGVGSWLVSNSLEAEVKIEQERQQRFIRNAAFEVVDNLGFELFSLYSNFDDDLNSGRITVTGPFLDQVAKATVRFRTQARFPSLLQEVCCLRWTTQGTLEYRVYSPEGWKVTSRPSWVPDRIPTTRLPFSLDSPVFVVAPREPRIREGALAAVALRFSSQAVVTEAVPALVRQAFSEGNSTPHFQAEVLHKNEGMPLFSRDPDLLVRLFPWSHFDSWFDHYVARLGNLDDARIADDLPHREGRSAWWSTVTARPILPEGSGWYLQVTRNPEGLSAFIQGLRLRNLALVAVFFLFIMAGFLVIFFSYLKIRALADHERAFMGLVSHELKTPLTVIRSLSENLSQGVVTQHPQTKEYGEVILDQAGRLTRMIENILLLTAYQKPSGRRVPLTLVKAGDLVERQVAWYRENHSGTCITVKAEENLPWVLVREEVVSAAVDNLLGNAIRHGRSSDGTSTVKIYLRPLKRRFRPGLEIEVADEGPGLTPQERKTLFKPFQRGQSAEDEQRPGSGVGLSLVKQILEASGGAVSIRSVRGQGTAVFLWLPGVR